MQNKRRKLAYEVIRGAPYLYVRSMGYGNVLSARGELDVFDRFLEVVMMQHYTTTEVDEKRTAIFVYRYQHA